MILFTGFSRNSRRYRGVELEVNHLIRNSAVLQIYCFSVPVKVRALVPIIGDAPDRALVTGVSVRATRIGAKVVS